MNIQYKRTKGEVRGRSRIFTQDNTGRDTPKKVKGSSHRGTRFYNRVQCSTKKRETV